MRRQNHRCGSTESLEVRQLLTGDFVFAKAILHSAQPELSASTNDLAVDSAGGTLVASEFSIFDPEDTEFKDTRAVVRKVNSSGTVVWERTLGSDSLHVDARSIAVDDQQNVYVVGSFRGIVDFNPSSGTTSLDGGEGSSYLWKLSPAGNLLWVRQLAGSNSQLVVSPAGNVYVTGTFQGTYDFDNGATVVELTSVTPGSYVVKYNSAGSLTWAKQFSSTGSISTGQASDAIEIDQNENVYVSGLFTGTADLNPGTGVFPATSPGINKSFLAKLTSAGDLTWAIVQTEKMLPKGLAVDGTGSVFLAGNFSGTADANPGPGNWPLISSGVSDIYLTKLDSAGAFAWSRRFGGTGDDLIGGVAVDGQGNPHLTGAWNGTVDFDPGPGIVNKTSSGQYDPFVLKVTSTAEFGWVRAFTGASNAYGTGIVVDSSGAITTTGEFSGLTDFDPGLAVNLLDSEQAVYVSRLSPDFLYQSSSAGADDFVLRKNGNNLELFHKGLNKVVESHPISQIRSVKINGQSSQADTLTIDMAFGGAFSVENGITFDGGSGVNSKIQIVGVSGQTALYRPSVTTGGTDNLRIDNTPLVIKQTQDVVISGVTTLNVQTQGSADTLSLDPGNGINNAVASKLTGNSSGSFLRPLTFHNVQDVTIDTGALDAATTGNDKITISTLGLRAVGMKNLTLSTGIGNDTLTVSSALQLPVAGGAFTFQAGTGTDTLNAQGDTNWTLTNTSLTSGAGGVLQLTGVENATLTGGASNNILNASLFSGNVTFHGRAGNDTLNGGTGVNHFVLEGTNAADHLELVKTRTGAAFRRRNRTNGLLLETDTITSPATMKFTVKALDGDDLISIDSLFTQAGTVDGGLGIDTCTAPGHWTKISC